MKRRLNLLRSFWYWGTGILIHRPLRGERGDKSEFIKLKFLVLCVLRGLQRTRGRWNCFVWTAPPPPPLTLPLALSSRVRGEGISVGDGWPLSHFNMARGLWERGSVWRRLVFLCFCIFAFGFLLARPIARCGFAGGLCRTDLWIGRARRLRLLLPIW